jgi:hypothetical protein
MNNILINQIITDGSSFSFKEAIPFYDASLPYPQALTMAENGDILWSPIDLGFNIIVNNQLRDTNIYYADGRLGLGRYPLYNYVLDVAIPKDTLMTALHIGDGSFGFSLGNGTGDGFIPEIIGIGSNESDAGLYFVGIAGNDISSNTPLIVFDGRSAYNTKLTNRPIMGITTGDYNNYTFLIDESGDIKIKGESLLEKLEDLQNQLNDLKLKIT